MISIGWLMSNIMLLDFLGIGEAIMKTVYWILLLIATAPYTVAAFGFKIFLILAEGQLIGSDSYQMLVNNIYAILGVVMLFIVAFMLLKLMINPEESKGATAIKKIVVNLITSIIGISLISPAFGFAYDVQKAVLDNNTIGKVFGGSFSKGNNDVTTGAYDIVNGVWLAFLTPVEKSGTKCDKLDTYDKIKNCYESIRFDKTSMLITTQKVLTNGSFSGYLNAPQALHDGDVSFDFIMSLIGGLLLVYISVSYCFDMGLRLVKLAFYQVIAPIPLLLRIIPDGKMSGVFGNWVKITVTCFMEVFVRILVLYFCVFLCGAITESDFLSGVLSEHGIFTYFFTKAFIFMGLITFMRQAPKLISEVTGIDSGNMKLGIKDKLAAGGAFTAGAIIGGGATAFARNAVNAGKNTVNKFKDIKGKTGKDKAKAIGGAALSALRGAGSIAAGTVSGQFRSGKAGLNAKSFGDMKSSAGKGAQSAVNARDKRASYKAAHGGTMLGAVGGHFKDAYSGAKAWAGMDMNDSELGYYSIAAQSSDSFLSMSESTYKKKPEYIEQSAKAKAAQQRISILTMETKTIDEQIAALQAQKKGANSRQSKILDSEIRTLQGRKVSIGRESDALNAEISILDNMQVDMAFKKRDVVALAATKLAVDQKTNYSGDAKLQNVYSNAMYEAFEIKMGPDTKTETISVDWINPDTGQTEKRNEKVFKFKELDEKGNMVDKTVRLSMDETSILDALLTGGAIDEKWISKENIKKVQEAIDKANIGRQHEKSLKEREHVIKTGNRSIDKKD